MSPNSSPLPKIPSAFESNRHSAANQRETPDVDSSGASFFKFRQIGAIDPR